MDLEQFLDDCWAFCRKQSMMSYFVQDSVVPRPIFRLVLSPVLGSTSFRTVSVSRRRLLLGSTFASKSYQPVPAQEAGRVGIQVVKKISLRDSADSSCVLHLSPLPAVVRQPVAPFAPLLRLPARSPQSPCMVDIIFRSSFLDDMGDPSKSK